MDTSSDSSFIDEEICIRPTDGSTETMKRFLQKEIVLPNTIRRNTYSGMDTLSGDFLASECSEYFTPDSTISKPNACFLEKMKAVLDEPSSSNTTFRTACDETANSTKVRRSSLPRLDTCTINELETLTMTDQKQIDIVISDDEIDDDFLRYQGTQIKYENISAVELDVDDVETDSSFINLKEHDKENKNVYDESASASSSLSESYIAQIYEPAPQCTANSSTYKLSTPLAERNEYFKMPSLIPSLPRKQYFVTPPKSTYNEEKSTIRYFHTQQSKHDNTADLDDSETVYTYERKKHFKMPSSLPRAPHFARHPTTPTTSAGKEFNFLTPTNLRVRKSADKFKHIQSPVGFYIKNSTTSAITRNFSGQADKRILLPEGYFDDVPDLSFRWEFEIPEIIYRPGMKRTMPMKEIHLPKNIQELVPCVTDICIAKHEARNKRTVNQDDVRRKLNEDMDLTRYDTVSAPQDISIIHVKNPFSKR